MLNVYHESLKYNEVGLSGFGLLNNVVLQLIKHKMKLVLLVLFAVGIFLFISCHCSAVALFISPLCISEVLSISII